jgi:probable Rubsico expression protein CbbX
VTSIATVDLEAAFRSSGVGEILDELDRQLVGLTPVKRRIREIAALLLVDKLRRELGRTSRPPSLHMAFIGNPGTGKTTVAQRMAEILHRLGYVRTSRLVSVACDDLVGQPGGHTAAKTKEMLEKAMGGVLYVDEACHLDRPEDEPGHGKEAIEFLLQVMETKRDDLVVILAGHPDRMERFFRADPGMRSRIAHHVEFPDYTKDELLAIAELMLAEQNYRFSPEGRAAFARYLDARMRQPHFANARSVRNALDRARLRRAVRLFESHGKALTVEDPQTIGPEEILASRVLAASPGERAA